MTWQERIQKKIKKHKKKTATHTMLGAILALVWMMGLNLMDHVGSASVSKDPNARVTIGLVGDMMFGRNVELIGKKYGYEYLFQHIQPYCGQADMMTGNFENAITKRKGNYPKADKCIHLNTNPHVAKTLKKVGFKTVNLDRKSVV